MKLFRIKNWHSCGFEVAQNRKAQNALPWVAIPTKHDGKGYRKLMRSTSGGPPVYGCWIVLVAVAGKSPIRGALVDHDGPLTAEDISLKTDMPEDLVAASLRFLCDEIGWIEEIEVESLDALHLSTPPPVDHQSTTGRATDVRTDGRKSVPSGSESDSDSESEQRPGGVGKSRPRPSVFDSLRHPRELTDVGRLQQWLTEQSKSRKPLLPDTGEGFATCVAVAITALEDGDNPLALFRYIIGKGKFDKLTPAIRSRAREIIQQHQRTTKLDTTTPAGEQPQ